MILAALLLSPAHFQGCFSLMGKARLLHRIVSEIFAVIAHTT
jgi:hypothetical protein